MNAVSILTKLNNELYNHYSETAIGLLVPKSLLVKIQDELQSMRRYPPEHSYGPVYKTVIYTGTDEAIDLMSIEPNQIRRLQERNNELEFQVSVIRKFLNDKA
jgi:hypothetical protein